MDPAPPTSTGSPTPATALPASSPAALPPASAVWPRSAQLATAFLLGLATALLIGRLWSMSRWSTRPLELERGRASSYRIDLNQADRGQFLQVPRIGDRTAEKIEAFRREQGGFHSPEELTHVRGIGPATYEKISEWFTVRSTDRVASDQPVPTSSKPRGPSPSSPNEKKPRTPSKKEENLKTPIDINQADGQELQQLPGIGPKMAQRILDERAKSPFRSVDDLRRVSGIGPKTLERLRPYVKIAPGSDRVAAEPLAGAQEEK